MKYKIEIGEQKFEVEVGEITDQQANVEVNGEFYDVRIDNFSEVKPGTTAPKRVRVHRPDAAPIAEMPAPKAIEPLAGAFAITAPIPGQILDIKVKVGDPVSVGQTVAILEAMKMENAVVSTTAGTVKEIPVERGADVATADVIMIIQ